MADGHDGVAGWDRIVGKHELDEFVDVGHRAASERQHRRRGIGCDHPVARVEEVASEKAAATAELDDKTVSSSGRFEELQDSWRHHVGVGSEAEMVHQRQILAVVGH